MPKTEKAKPKRACPLEKQLAFDNKAWYDHKSNSKSKTDGPTSNGKSLDDDMDEEQDVVPEKLSRRTLALARQQQVEEQRLQQRERARQLSTKGTASTTRAGPQEDKSSDESDEEELDAAGQDEDMDEYDGQDVLVRMNGDYVEEIEMCDDDEEALAAFMVGAPERRNLADIIMDKIFEKEARDRGEGQENNDDDGQAVQRGKFDAKIVQVYTGVGKILQRYTSGKLPKAFKVIPSLSYWEDILWLTSPEKWSPHAMRAATRLFASNLNPKMAQRFFNIFLLEHVRQDIHENKRLNFHLYMALKKALYKPQAFFKGIVIPLCESRNCTQREAAIIGSVLSKVSVPVIQSAATLMKLASMEYAGGNSMFIRVLLNKKYSLPTRVISELSQHFVRFTSDTRKLPVLWHQSLLVFAQRYKNDIPKQHKEAMKALFKQHFHHQITPEIRRELYNEM
uniref:Bystin n=1 Tax=Hyaloperonospora arabidopsidis (strain Emoy2) TaxID=559515 RepID=M4C6D9_HYAAE